MKHSSPETAPTTSPTRRAEASDPHGLASRRQRSLGSLLEARRDLVGVYPWADLMHDSVRWSA